MNAETDRNALMNARLYAVGDRTDDPRGIRRRVHAQGGRMTLGVLSEYAVAALLVGVAVWKLATSLWSLELSSLIEATPRVLAMLAAFTACLAASSTLAVRRNARERHDLERLQAEFADP